MNYKDNTLDKVMILGTGFLVDPDMNMHPTLRGAERLNRALEYYHDIGGRAVLLCSGGYSGARAYIDGTPPSHLREAYVMADYLMSEGNVPHAQIEVEPNSTSTVTNFTYAMRDGLLVPQDYGRESPLGVVTHPYHMNRAAFIAEKLGLTIQAIPTDEEDNKWRERRLLNEYRIALLGAHGVEAVEQRERVMATLGNMLRRS